MATDWLLGWPLGVRCPWPQERPRTTPMNGGWSRQFRPWPHRVAHRSRWQGRFPRHLAQACGIFKPRTEKYLPNDTTGWFMDYIPHRPFPPSFAMRVLISAPNDREFPPSCNLYPLCPLLEVCSTPNRQSTQPPPLSASASRNAFLCVKIQTTTFCPIVVHSEILP